MTKEKIYNIADELSEQEVGLLVCYKLSQTKKAEMGWFCDSGDGKFYGICQWIPNEGVLDDTWEFTDFNRRLKTYVDKAWYQSE